MSVILTSTGVTFPDSTTQTTAAGAASYIALGTATFSGSTTSVTYAGGTYYSYLLVYKNVNTTGSCSMYVKFIYNGSANSDTYRMADGSTNTSGFYVNNPNTDYNLSASMFFNVQQSPTNTLGYYFIPTTTGSTMRAGYWGPDSGPQNATFSGFQFTLSSQTFTGGTCRLFGITTS